MRQEDSCARRCCRDRHGDDDDRRDGLRWRSGGGGGGGGFHGGGGGFGGGGFRGGGIGGGHFGGRGTHGDGAAHSAEWRGVAVPTDWRRAAVASEGAGSPWVTAASGTVSEAITFVEASGTAVCMDGAGTGGPITITPIARITTLMATATPTAGDLRHCDAPRPPGAAPQANGSPGRGDRKASRPRQENRRLSDRVQSCL